MSTTALQQDQERDRRTGIVATIVFHVLITILFLFFGLKQPNPLPLETAGIEMDFGSSDMGGGSDAAPGPPSPTPAPSTAAPTPAESAADEVATQDDSPVTEVRPEKPVPKPKPKPQPKPEPEKPAEPSLDPRLRDLLQSPWGGGGTGGQGPDEKPGDKGTPDGTPGAIGTMRGDGWEIRGGNRGAARGPDLNQRVELQNETEVEIRVTVDRAGNIVGQPRVSNTRTARVDIQNAAIRAVSAMQFVANPNGPPEQMLYVTIRFRPS